MIRLRANWHVGLLLVALTLGAFILAESGFMRALGGVAIFLIAALKTELVLANFMEIQHAQPHWRWLYRIWTAVVSVALALSLMI